MKDNATSKSSEKPERNLRSKIIALGLLVVALLGAGVVAMIPKRNDNERPAPPPPVNVAVLRIQPAAKFVDSLRLPGIVEPSRVVKVSAEVAARVDRIECGEGVPCRKGDKLIELNTDLLQAEHNRTKAQADYDKWQYDHTVEARQRKAATPNEVELAKSKAEASNAAMELTRQRLRRATILAPIDGVLNRFPVEIGEYVQPGQQVAEIVEVDRAKVVVQVPERDILYLKKGQTEEIQCNGARNLKLIGKITYISELADERTRTTRVEINVDNRPRFLRTGPNDGHAQAMQLAKDVARIPVATRVPLEPPARPLRSGQIVHVCLKRQILKNVILVPLQAVISRETDKIVYVVVNGKAQPRQVRLGLYQGRRVQIVSGLRAGDALIVSGLQYVGPDQEVKIQTKSQDTALAAK